MWVYHSGVVTYIIILGKIISFQMIFNEMNKKRERSGKNPYHRPPETLYLQVTDNEPNIYTRQRCRS